MTKTRYARIHVDLYNTIKDLAKKEKVPGTIASKYLAKEYMNAKVLEKKLELNLRTGTNKNPIIRFI